MKSAERKYKDKKMDGKKQKKLKEIGKVKERRGNDCARYGNKFLASAFGIAIRNAMYCGIFFLSFSIFKIYYME